ncbi:GHMP family kinase ATP-binding protein [Micromonospora okii]|uniref:GHMP family kinase ATP-binding protein n=1 Tax=Micromonospora okii TaxID=1182970 RepID=UPI001E36CECE|nr:hypothetical protein [Micromonospora okii]
MTLAARIDNRVEIIDEMGGELFDSPDEVPHNPRYRLFVAALSHFGLTGVTVRMVPSLPPGMGLGGSGAAMVALVTAADAFANFPHRSLTRSAGALLAHRLEAATSPTPVGLQDHLAAAFGGVSLWNWHPPSREPPFERSELTDPALCAQLDRRLLLALTDEAHSDGGMTAVWVRSARKEPARVWLESALVTRAFGVSMSLDDWRDATEHLRRECRLRLDRWPETLTPVGHALAGAVTPEAGAARFCGGGAGGAVWALVDPRCRDDVRARWHRIVGDESRVFTPKVDREGLVVRCRGQWTSR